MKTPRDSCLIQRTQYPLLWLHGGQKASDRDSRSVHPPQAEVPIRLALLQAFRYHAKTPLIHILKSEWNNGNFLRLLYAGAPAALLHQCLAILIPFALDELCEAVKVHLCDKYKSPKTLEALIYLTEITRNS